jgi:hypothetical protein
VAYSASSSPVRSLPNVLSLGEPHWLVGMASTSSRRRLCRLFCEYLLAAVAVLGEAAVTNADRGPGDVVNHASAFDRRILPGDEDNNNNNNNRYNSYYYNRQRNNGGNNNNVASSSFYSSSNNEDGDNAFVTFFKVLTGRVEEDAHGMWDSAPSAWQLEYWEVLAIFIGVILAIICVVCTCCSCCCTNQYGGVSDLPKDRIVATSSQADEYVKAKRHYQQQQHHKRSAGNNDLSEPILLATTSGGAGSLRSGGAGSLRSGKSQQQQIPTNEYSPAIHDGELEAASGNGNNMQLVKSHSSLDDDNNYASHHHPIQEESNNTRGRSRKQRLVSSSKKFTFWDKTAFVWKETVSVWGEFLGLSNEPSSSNTIVDKEDSFYKEYKSTAAGKEAAASSSTTRKKSSKRSSNRTKEIV